MAPGTPRQVTANHTVAINLRRARELRGWTQEQAAEELKPHLGRRLSKASFSAAERSPETGRPREFTADELVAFAAGFHLPVSFFLMPPAADSEVAGIPAVDFLKHVVLDLDRATVTRVNELTAGMSPQDALEVEQRIAGRDEQFATKFLDGLKPAAWFLRVLADHIEEGALDEPLPFYRFAMLGLAPEAADGDEDS